MRKLRRLLALLCLVAFVLPLCAEPTVTIDSYTQDHIPDWAHDLRRTEIITLGSLPFTTLAAKIGYTFWRYYKNDFDPGYLPNPLAKTSEGALLDVNEQKTVLKIGIVGSLIFGLTDFGVTWYHRWRDSENEKELQQKLAETVTITPVVLESEGEVE